jgi:peptidoglycan hydrolase-like protein with peptidoglycan-binding domain
MSGEFMVEPGHKQLEATEVDDTGATVGASGKAAKKAVAKSTKKAETKAAAEPAEKESAAAETLNFKHVMEAAKGEAEHTIGVRVLQRALVAEGVLAEDDVTGEYDNATRNAVRRYQAKLNVVRRDGVIRSSQLKVLAGQHGITIS